MEYENMGMFARERYNHHIELYARPTTAEVIQSIIGVFALFGLLYIIGVLTLIMQ